MIQTLKIFFTAEKTKPWAVLLCLVLGGFAEALGIGSLLPIAASIMGSDKSGTSPLQQSIVASLTTLGIKPNLETLLIVMVLFMLLRAALLFAASVYSGMAGARVTVNLRRRLITSIFEARWSYYSSQSGGRIANALSNDANRAGDAYNFAALMAASVIQVFTTILVAFLINWHVAMASLVAGLVIALLLNRLVTMTRNTGNKITNRVAAFTSDMIDVMNNIKALKSMHRYDVILLKLADQLRRIRNALLMANVARAGLTYGNDAAIVVVAAAAAFVAVKMAHVTLGELTVFGVLFSQFIYAISRLQKNYQSAAQIESAYLSVSGMIDETMAAREINASGKVPMIGQGCTFKNVSFAHEGALGTTIENATFEIPAHGITVLQGPSGAGKTTLIDLLIGFHRPQSGHIMIGLDDLNAIDVIAWRKSLGYVPQELVLFHDTVRANIAMYDETISDEAIARALSLAGADSFMKDLRAGLNTDVGEMGGKLSGGQRQRISLARALVTNPKIIILDEVTSALDPETEAEIVANIKALRGAYTIIAITHRPAWSAIADRLYRVDGGHIANITPSRQKAKALS